MRERNRIPGVRGVEVVNLQPRCAVHTAAVLRFARELRRRLRLGKRAFNICFVDDNAMRRLNLTYRRRDKATDVLSFPWNKEEGQNPRRPLSLAKQVGLTNFLGDVVISVESARRNAEAEGHSTLKEIRWLVLHGVLHLLGYDHSRDQGEMTALELALREQLSVAGSFGRKEKAKGKRQKTKGKT
jgi:probable rRNA maturation factor